MEAEKEQKLRELQDRQERMFNWEDQVKASEDALMEGFRKQKEEMIHCLQDELIKVGILGD